MFRAVVVLLSAALMSTVLAAQTVCFHEVFTPDLANGFAAIYDANFDGKSDLAVSRPVISAYAVNSALGNGDGTFKKIKAYPRPAPVTGISHGDFNNDGKDDLAVAYNVNDGNSGAVEVLLGKGDGTFPKSARATTQYPTKAIAVADFNHDGKLDVAVTTGPESQPPYDVEVLLGHGDGTLQHAVSAGPLTGDTRNLAVADLNGDGNMDLLASSQTLTNQTLSVFLGNGDGTFQPPQNYSLPVNGNANIYALSIAVADYNADGKLDVAIPAPPDVAVLYGNGTGTLSGPTFIQTPTEPGSLVAVDLFGNGLQDIVGNDALDTANISVAINNGDGTFTVQEYPIKSFTGLVYSGDFNADGKPDLLVLYSSPQGYSVLLNCSSAGGSR